MAQVAPSPEPPETPPPIPSRSHLRNDSAFQLKLYASKSDTGNMAGTPSFAASQALLQGIDCKSADTEQRLPDSDNKRGPELREDCRRYNVRSQNKRSHVGGEEGGSSEVCRSAAGVGAGLPDNLQEPLHLALSIPQLVISYENEQQVSEDHSKIDGEAVDASKHTATQSGKCHATTSTCTKTGSDLTSHSLQSSQYQRKTTDTKVSDWLRHGLLDSLPPEVGFQARNSESSDRSFASRRVPLSLFPPKSSSADVREYMPRNGRSVCPVSPLNNGRDAYGNHIPSNTRDYFTAHSQTSLQKPLTVKNEKVPSNEKPLTAGQQDDCRWDRFKSFWKVAGIQSSNHRADPRYPHIILDTDNIPRDVPEVMYLGRVGDRGLHSVRPPFPAAYSQLDSPVITVKGNYSTPDLRGGRAQDAKSSLQESESVGAGETPVSKNRFDVTCNHENTSRDRKMWQKENLPVLQSVQIGRNKNDMSVYSNDGRTVNLVRGESSDTCRKVEHERQMQPTEKKEQARRKISCDTEGQLTSQQEARKQDQRVACEDANTAAITPPQAKGPFKLERMLDFGIQIPRKSTSSSRNLPHNTVSAPPQDLKKQKPNIVAPGHAAVVPALASAMSSTTEKPQPLFRTMLSKAGNISRSIFTASFDSKSKALTQHQPSTDSSKTSLPKFSMSADRDECPSSNSPNTHEEASTLAGHYQVLTAGAFDDSPPSHHDRHASLASVTNEALLIADRLLQRDARWSTDQVRSSFSSDSTSEIVPQQQEDEMEKKKNKKKGEVARAMAWMGLYV